MTTIRTIVKRTLAFCSSVAIMLTAGVLFPLTIDAQTTNSTDNQYITSLSYTYSDYLNDAQKSGFVPYTGKPLRFEIDTVQSEADLQYIDDIPVVISDEEHPNLLFTVTVEQDGLYEIGGKYIFVEATGYEGSRKLTVDGESLYMEADNIAFYRYFVDVTAPKKNAIGDEVSPATKEILEWQENRFYDNLGRNAAPLMIALTAGVHTIALEYVGQAIAFAYIELLPQTVYQAYEEYAKDNVGAVTGVYERFQAEKCMTMRNNSSIGLASDGDPTVIPNKPGYLLKNTVGGYAYRNGGQSISFKVDVKTSSYYHINIRCKQSWNIRMNSYRKIEINGQVPFKELECYPFTFDNHWQNEVLGSEDQPFLIYLQAGPNEITLTAQLGDNTTIIQLLEYAVEELSILNREILMIIGQSPDPNYDYELDRVIPNLKERFDQISKYIDQARQMCNDQNGGADTEIGNGLDTNSRLLLELKKNVDEIPKRFSEIGTVSTSLGSTLSTLQQQPLQIDYIEVFTPEQQLEERRATFFQYVSSTFKSFLVSFTKDYTAVASDISSEVNETVEVWVGRGKEWAQILKEMADSRFTANTGIGVKFNVVPSGSLSSSGSANLLLLSVASGTQPDIAMGIPIDMPVEYAMREASAELSCMPGYDEVISRFANKRIMVPFEYNDGYYGIPETASFSCMYYRTDIFGALGLQVPKTWTEVFETLVPVLNENGMQFYLGSNNPYLFILSNGGSVYRTDEAGHLVSAFDSQNVYDAFKLFTEAFTLYGLPTAANFFNRFRTGEMPIGIGENSLYMQLLSAAPELTGKWDIVPLPYMETTDGTLSRGYPGLAATSLIILSASEKKDSAWSFVDWWTSDETQVDYAQRVEGQIGLSARWISANKAAFLSLPWNKSVITVAKAHWEDVVGIPYVPGGYLTGTHLMNAWNRVVLNGMLPRESLEISIEAINKELERKRIQLERKYNRQ